MDNSLSNLLLVILVIGVVMVILVVVAAYFVIRQLQRFTAPDLAEMRKKVADLQRDNPGASRETLIQRVIQEQSIKCGVVGAITGLGGFVTLPVALPVDILMSLRLQATMVQFIALMYGEVADTSQELKLQTYLVMAGGTQVTETTFNLVMKFVLRIIGKSLSKLVPVIGAVVGFIVNYGIAQATGNIAMRWYASRARLAPGSTPIRG
jgi:hypothetical protein